MMKLLKYEGRKTRFVKLILLVIAALLEGAFLYAFYAEKWDTMAVITLLLTITAFSGIVLVGIQSLVTLHRDMNTKQGYMLFMTPHSSYAILGAKVAECALSLVVCGLFFFAMGYLDIHLVLRSEGVSAWRMILGLFRTVAGQLEVTLPNVIAFFVLMIISWLGTITAAFLADVVSSSFLNGKKGNLLITFVLFILLNVLTGKIGSLVPESLRAANAFYFRSGISLALSALMYYVTAKMMDRYLSV